MSEIWYPPRSADRGVVPRGGPTTVPAQDFHELDGLDRDITSALAELRVARRRSDPSADPDTARAEELAEWRLNRLLERRHDAVWR